MRAVFGLCIMHDMVVAVSLFICFYFHFIHFGWRVCARTTRRKQFHFMAFIEHNFVIETTRT